MNNWGRADLVGEQTALWRGMGAHESMVYVQEVQIQNGLRNQM